MEQINIWEWLIQQAPVIVVMGIAIYYLATKLTKAEKDKDELAKEVIRLTSIWEIRLNDSKNNDRDIMQLLTQIKDLFLLKK